MKCCRPPSFSSTIMGRSWADHGQIMGRPWAIDSCRKILKISAFSDTVFFRKIMKICDFPTRLEQSVKLFLHTPLVVVKPTEEPSGSEALRSSAVPAATGGAAKQIQASFPRVIKIL